MSPAGNAYERPMALLNFNAARLDRSLALSTEDYKTLARPRLARIAKR